MTPRGIYLSGMSHISFQGRIDWRFSSKKNHRFWAILESELKIISRVFLSLKKLKSRLSETDGVGLEDINEAGRMLKIVSIIQTWVKPRALRVK
jgi:hypothetical protein